MNGKKFSFIFIYLQNNFANIKKVVYIFNALYKRVMIV